MPPTSRPATAILVEPTTVEAATVITLAGELDLADGPALHQCFAVALSGTAPTLIVDLRRVTFLDCSILGVLVAAHHRAVQLGGRLRLVAPQALPLMLLELTHLDRILMLQDTIGPAGDPR